MDTTKNRFSFIWFLVFAFYAGALVLCAVNFTSLPLLPVLFILCLICSGKKPLLAAGMTLVAGIACLFGAGEGEVWFCAMLFVCSLICVLVFNRGYAFDRTAWMLTAAVFVFAAGFLCRQVYLSVGSVGIAEISAVISDKIAAGIKAFSDMAVEMYGDTMLISAEQLTESFVAVTVSSLGGTLIMISSIAGLAGAASAHKVRYPTIKLLENYNLSPVGALVITVSFFFMFFASGKTRSVGENLFFALSPAFAVQGVKGVINTFKRRRISFFGLMLVTIVIFNAGLLPALVLLGVVDIIRRMFAHEKQK